MKIIKNIKEIREVVYSCNDQHQKIALIPTMGALHDGHISLIKKAKNLAEIVIVSIFVNKTQFNDLSDYEKYPRQFMDDFLKLESENVDYVFAPDGSEIYPNECDFNIVPKNFANCLCGSFRAGHFNGVALIITKLFNIIKPNFAIFGQKDFQQLLIIKKLVNNFNFDTEIHDVPTLREKNGLAMSSRNKRLNKDQLNIAGQIFRILNDIKDNYLFDSKILEKKSQEMIDIGFDKVEYLEIRDEQNLNLVNNYQINNRLRIFIAVYLGGVRLIDNLKIN